MKKIYKVIEQENGTITFYGSNKWIELHYAKDDRQYFRFHNSRYYLDDFMNIHNSFHNPNPPEYMKEFDGYINDSFFSGVCIKLDKEEDYRVKAYLFIS